MDVNRQGASPSFGSVYQPMPNPSALFWPLLVSYIKCELSAKCMIDRSRCIAGYAYESQPRVKRLLENGMRWVKNKLREHNLVATPVYL